MLWGRLPIGRGVRLRLIIISCRLFAGRGLRLLAYCVNLVAVSVVALGLSSVDRALIVLISVVSEATCVYKNCRHEVIIFILIKKT